jgi:hypothetical protein
MKYSIAIAIIAVLALAPAAMAINSNAGTSAFTFLRIGTGAKSQAMGGAFVGLADDASAIYYNPAGLTVADGEDQGYDELLDKPINITPKNNFTASYINYLLDFQYGFLGYVRDIDSTTAAGISVAYQNYGTFNRLDAEGNKSGTFGASDLAFGLTYSKRLSPRFTAGLTGKFIYEKLEDYTANGLAADLGIMYLINPNGSTRVGLAFTNLGAQLSGLTKQHKDQLPSKVSAGISHHLVGVPILFSGEVGKPFDNDFYLSAGGEVTSLKPFFLRFGWTTQGKDYKTGGNNEFLAGFAGGFGLLYKNYQIDYSYSSYSDLGSVHRITMAAGF